MDQRDFDKMMMHGHPYPIEPISLFEQVRCPTIDKEYIRERLKLPEKFMGHATLKEGTFVTVLITQCVAVAFSAYLVCYLTIWKNWGDATWRTKLYEDFDYHIDRSQPMKEWVESTSKLWVDIAKMLVITHIVYFGTGVLVWIGLCNNYCHPFVYIPWLLMTAFLVSTCFGSAFFMFGFNCFLAAKRPIVVTWDVVPMICVFLYAIAWAYGFFTVWAHYNRRCIVRYWRRYKPQN